MKVLHLMKTSEGGAWAYRQMRELVRLGVEVHVLLPQNGPMVARYKKAGIKIHINKYYNKYLFQINDLLNIIFLVQLLKSINPDIIHSHFVITTLLMRLALWNRIKIPRIFQVPGPLHLENKIFRLLDILSSNYQDYWIGSCNWTCQCYRNSGIHGDRIFLSYYGIDLIDFQNRQTGVLRSELGLADHIKLIGMVAFMYPPKYYLGQTKGIKGHEDLIDAIAICVKENPNIRCVFVGGAWGNAKSYEKRIRKYAEKKCAHNIIFLGNRTDVPSIYPDFDLVVHPSHSENIGGAGESLLMGIPTIATNVGGFPDIIREGETGWLVPAHSPILLAAAIKNALKNPQLGVIYANEGQKIVRNKFDVLSTSKDILTIYKTVQSYAIQ